MLISITSWFSVILTLVASTIILIHRDWRISLGALAVQYLAAFWLITVHIPLVMGSAKLVTGWMTVAIIGMTRLGITTPDDNENSLLPRSKWFRIILMGIVTLVAGGSMIRIEDAIPGLGLQVISGSLILIGAGVLQLSMTSDLLRVILGLLSLLMGFEILYAAVESSILVAGLLAAITLGLGIVGSYLLTTGAPALEIDGQEL